MNGRAPKLPATGSQVFVTKKLQPNLARASAERTQSWYTSKTVINRRVAAANSVMRCAISSAPRMRRRNARGLHARLAGVAAFGVVAISADSDLAIRNVKRYWICAIAFISLATISFGSLAYDSASQDCCPSVIIHFRKSFTTSRLAVSVNFAGINSHVKLAIG